MAKAARAKVPRQRSALEATMAERQRLLERAMNDPAVRKAAEEISGAHPEF